MGELKYIIFFIVLIAGVPFNYIIAKKYPQYENLLWFLLIFFTVNMTDINFMSVETYRGTSRGFEIGMVDITAFSLLALIIHRKNEFPIGFPPGTFLYFLYFLFSAISIVNSDVIAYSLMELWKMLRMYLYCFVVYNLIRSFEDFKKILLYFSWILVYITYFVLEQKYIQGRWQCPGPFPHQNSMVMYVIILSSLIMAYVVNTDKLKLYYWLPVLGGAAIDIISSLSRGGMALFGLSMSIVLFLSYTSKVTLKKISILLLFIFVGSLGLYKASDSIINRFETAPEESANGRIELALAAQKMANDKIFGVGVNNWGIKINYPYSYGDHIRRDSEDTKMPLVETIYLMIAAETGWHNLVIFLTLLFYMYFLNLRNYFQMKNHQYRFLTIGLMGGLLAIYIQSSLEWVLKQTNNFYELMLVFALIGVMRRLLNEEKNHIT